MIPGLFPSNWHYAKILYPSLSVEILWLLTACRFAGMQPDGASSFSPFKRLSRCMADETNRVPRYLAQHQLFDSLQDIVCS